MDDHHSYSFNGQLQSGEQGEVFLDEYFARWFILEPASPAEQRQGIDRFFTTRNRKRRFAVEYKTDNVAARTGNAFIETISVDVINKPGWAYTSQAEYLLYYVPGKAVVYMMPMAAIRRCLALWLEHFPHRQIPNNGYNSYGLLVPLGEFERYAEGVFMTNSSPV